MRFLLFLHEVFATPHGVIYTIPSYHISFQDKYIERLRSYCAIPSVSGQEEHKADTTRMVNVCAEVRFSIIRNLLKVCTGKIFEIIKFLVFKYFLFIQMKNLLIVFSYILLNNRT